MITPDFREFIGWNRPAIELVAEKLEALNESVPDTFRRATVVVPTSESGRRLREYMAERAGKPILMPRIILAGQLIPTDGGKVAGEMEILAAWLQVLGSSTVMQGKTPAWLLDVARQLQRVREQLEQENRSPDCNADALNDFVTHHLQEDAEAWKDTIAYEQERWNHLRTMFGAVDDVLAARGLKSPERVRAEELAHPKSRGLLIIACVPELSPQNRLYMTRLAETGAAGIRVWVNAPEDERERFDAFGQPIPFIELGTLTGQGWCECVVQIPRLPHPGESCPDISESDVIHSVAGRAEFGRKARQLAGGYDSEQLVIASCDSSFSASLVTAFKPEWNLMLPEGRSFLSTEVGQIPHLLHAACVAMHPAAESDAAIIGEMTAASGRRLADFLPLLRNLPLQQCLAPELSTGGMNARLDMLVSEHLPFSEQHLLTLARREFADKRESDYVIWVERVIQLADACCDDSACAPALRGLAAAIEQRYAAAEGKMQAAVRHMTQLMRQAAALAESGGCDALSALALLEYSVENSAAGALEGAERRDSSINVRGWRELSYTRAPRVILTGLHEGSVPERIPADAWLPDSYRSFLKMTDGESRRARDTFLFTALLQSRPVGAVQVVLARSSADGTPIAPSSLLLRCATLQESAERVSRLYADPPQPLPESLYAQPPLLRQGNLLPPEPGKMESICLLAPSVANPWASPERTWSPSSIKRFLDCPLRFWLDCLLHVNPGDELDTDKAEPDAAEYGNLLHAVLQAVAMKFASAPADADRTELQRAIETFAAECVEREVTAGYGDDSERLSATLKLTKRNLLRSVRAWAVFHAEDLCAGWEVLLCEHQLEFCLDGGAGEPPIPIRMRVDRVDRHRDGTYRVIDYKTNATPPDKVHWENLSENAAALYSTWMPPELLLEADGKVKRWAGVQLPLYAEGLRQIFRLEELPVTAFYNLPRTKPQGVGYHPLEQHEHHEAAMDCVRRAVKLMRAGECLFSAESLGRVLSYNQFGALSIYRNPDPRPMCSLPPLPVVTPTSSES